MMKLPNLQSEKINAWLEALNALSPYSPKEHDVIVKDLTLLLEMMMLQGAAASSVTASQISECLHLYVKILAYCLARTGGYEYAKTKEQYKIIAKSMLSHLRPRTKGWQTVRQNMIAIGQKLPLDVSSRDTRLWPAVKAVCKPFYPTAMRDFATLANDHIHFSENDHIAMVFHPTNNSLHFLTKVKPVDGGDSQANIALNLENEPKRLFKIFNPIAEEPQPGDAVDGDASSAAAAKKPTPIVGMVSEKNLPDGIAENNVIDINLQRLPGPNLNPPFQLCFHLRDGELRVVNSDPDNSFSINIPHNKVDRRNYFYHPSQSVVFVLSGDKTITVKIGDKNAINHTISTDGFPCAVKQIAVSPDGFSLVVLLANGMFVPCKVTSDQIRQGFVASSTNVNFIANKIQWLNNECFTLLNEDEYLEVYRINTDTVSVQMTHGDNINGVSRVCFMPFHLNNYDLGGNVSIDPKQVTGVSVYNGPEGTSLGLYRMHENGKIKLFRPSTSQNKSRTKSKIPHHVRNKIPMGLALAANNRYVAIRYADYSIDVVDLRTLLPSASNIGIFRKATKSISSYGEYTGGYCAD